MKQGCCKKKSHTLNSLIDEQNGINEQGATLLVYLLSHTLKSGCFFCLLHKKLRAGWRENLKNLSEHALLLGTSEYVNSISTRGVGAPIGFASSKNFRDYAPVV